MTKVLAVPVFVILFAFLISCNSPSPPKHRKNIDLPDTDKNMGKTQKNVDQASKSLGQSADNIDKANKDIGDQAGKIKKKSSEKSKKKIEPHIEGIMSDVFKIDKETDKLRALRKKLDKVSSQLSKAKNQVKLLIKQIYKKNSIIAGKDKQIDKLREESNKKLKRNMRWMITIGAGLIVISLALVFTGNAKAITGAIIGGLSIATGFAVTVLTQYQWMFGVCLGLGLLVLIGVIGYMVYQYVVDERSLKETVNMLEKAKPDMPLEVKEYLFGSEDGKQPGLVDRYQSKNTKKKINDVKNKIKKKELKDG